MSDDGPGSDDRDAGDGGQARAQPRNDSTRFDRLPATPADRAVEGRASRAEVLDWWDTRFDIPSETFAEHTFWEKGAGKVWGFAGTVPDPLTVETLGMAILRTRQEHWKPTTNAVQRFGDVASRNVLVLERPAARKFMRGEDQPVAWDGDWGYLIVGHQLAGDRALLGVGLYLDGELRSQIPKARRLQS